MVVVTILEWVPALRINDTDWLYLMVIPLLLCNAYQLLVLHRLIGKQVNQLNREVLYNISYNVVNGMIKSSTTFLKGSRAFMREE